MNERLLRAHAIIMAKAITAYAKIEGMKAENYNREHQGQSPAYKGADFEKAVEGLDHNSIYCLLSC